MNARSVALPVSARAPACGISGARAVPQDERATVTLVLRRRTALPVSPDGPERIAEADFAELYGADPRDVQAIADPRDIQAVAEALHEAEVDGLETHLASRRMRVAGTAAALGVLFGASLQRVDSPETVVPGRSVTHRRSVGNVTVPTRLAAIIVAVLGLDDRPQARVHLRAAVEPKVNYPPPVRARAG